MKKVFYTVGLTIAMVGLSGCSTWSTSHAEPATGMAEVHQTGRKTKAENVQIYEKDITDRKYKVIADISATVRKTTVFNSNPTKEHVNEKLKYKAAELGADAVIMVRYGDLGASPVSWGSLNGKGRAIVFIK